MVNNLLVTIAICTYNNARYIVETLESIKDQTYDSLELIISDDASSDATLQVVTVWTQKPGNSNRFARIEVLKADQNTGVSANANRALRAARGSWIKYIAGDDTLKPGCISDNMQQVSSDPQTKVLFSRVEIYRESFTDKNLIDITRNDSDDRYSIMATGRDADEQYKMLLVSDRIHYAPSAFLHRETLLSIGGFNEEYKLLEDYPLWLNLTKHGHKLCFMDKITVQYRRHGAAINNNGRSCIVNPNYFRSEPFRRKFTYPYLPADIRLNQKFIWVASQVFRIDSCNKNSKAGRFFYTLLTIWLNPFRIYIFLKKRFRVGHSKNVFYF